MGIGENVHSGEQSGNEVNRPASLTIGIVKDNWNVLHPGKVKVTIKDEKNSDMETEWMPVASPYAANKCGMFMLPEVGSTVIIGYIDDNSVSPVVIGSIWSTDGVSKSNLPTGMANNKNTIKVFSTSKGHMIKFTESTDKSQIEILTPEKQKIKLDDKKGKITLSSKSSESEIVLDGKSGKISLTAKTEIALKIGTNDVIKLTQSEVNIKSSAKIKIDAGSLEVKGNQAKISGGTLDLKADGQLNVDSSGIAQIKGTMLKLN